MSGKHTGYINLLNCFITVSLFEMNTTYIRVVCYRVTMYILLSQIQIYKPLCIRSKLCTRWNTKQRIYLRLISQIIKLWP